MTRTGFFEKYFITPFFREYADFKTPQPRRDAMISLLAWGIVTAGVVGVLLGLVGLLGPEVGFVSLGVVGGLWLLASVYPMAALFVRSKVGSQSLDEVGSQSDEVVSRPAVLGIDKMLAAICVLFLIFGILMAVTTLNSGELNMNPRGSGDDSDNPILMQDSVWEEPIFNYQSETKTEIEDDFEDGTNADSASYLDSYDPAAASIDTISLN